MKRGATLCIIALLTLTACGPQVVQYNHAAAALLYADIKEMYGVVKVDLVRACSPQPGAAARLDADTCGRLKAADVELAVVDAIVREMLKNPKSELDMEKLGTFVRAAIKMGAASQTGGMSGLLLR